MSSHSVGKIKFTSFGEVSHTTMIFFQQSPEDKSSYRSVLCHQEPAKEQKCNP